MALKINLHVVLTIEQVDRCGSRIPPSPVIPVENWQEYCCGSSTSAMDTPNDKKVDTETSRLLRAS